MNFELNDDQRMMKALVERFVADRYAPGQRAAYRSSALGYAQENWALLAEMGLLALPFTADEGGLEGGPIEIITVMEAIGCGLVVEPLLQDIIVGGRLLAIAGTAAQKEAWLPAIIAGERHIGLAFAEHDMRWSLDKPETCLVQADLVGVKTFVPAHADAYIVTASTAEGTGLFLVDAQAMGVTRRNYMLVDGSVACELRLDRVNAEQMEGGLAAVAAVADDARLAACAEMIGIATIMFETTLDYVRQRQQFGAALGTFQAIQHRLADLYASLELGRSQLYRAAMSGETERHAAIAAAKAYISSMALHLGEECIQFHGGMGVSDELDLGHGHKRVMLLASLFGDADHEIARYNAALRAA